MFILIISPLLLITGSRAISGSALQLLRHPGENGLDPKMYKYSIDPNEGVIQDLVDDIVERHFYREEDMKGWLRDVTHELGRKEGRKSKNKSSESNPQNPDGESWLDKSIGFLKGLLGDENPESSTEPTGSLSQDEQTMVEDIKKYLDNIIDNKNGTLEHVLRYVVSYVHKNVHFWLFTRSLNGFEDLTIGKTSNISSSNFDRRKRTVILIHGWINSGESYYSRSMVKAFEKFGDFNIIAVDWSELSYNLYTLSRIAVNFVGPYVAKMIEFLWKHHDVKPAELHVLGHSLGAHIAGIAGMFVKHGKIGRITGFDPASPLFGDDQKYRLDAKDAKFVDVIHTSILGMSEQLGHADFYPNGGGPSQPGCGINFVVCPHRRSFQYFISSMSDNNFLAFSCGSWEGFTQGNCTDRYVHMGIHLPRRSRGKFYLRTSSETPFALGMKTLEPTVEPTSESYFL